MRNIIIKRINKIKSVESDFKSEYWNGVNFSVNSETKHISEIDCSELNDEQLVRYFEYFIRMQCEIVDSRTNNLFSNLQNQKFTTFEDVFGNKTSLAHKEMLEYNKGLEKHKEYKSKIERF